MSASKAEPRNAKPRQAKSPKADSPTAKPLSVSHEFTAGRQTSSKQQRPWSTWHFTVVAVAIMALALSASTLHGRPLQLWPFSQSKQMRHVNAFTSHTLAHHFTAWLDACSDDAEHACANIKTCLHLSGVALMLCLHANQLMHVPQKHQHHSPPEELSHIKLLAQGSHCVNLTQVPTFSSATPLATKCFVCLYCMQALQPMLLQMSLSLRWKASTISKASSPRDADGGTFSMKARSKDFGPQSSMSTGMATPSSGKLTCRPPVLSEACLQSMGEQ